MAAIAADVVGFWKAAGPQKWFARDARFDEAIRLKFEPTHHAAARGDYAAWAQTPEGALALMLLLDQFPRNLYRGSAHSYATDPLARAIADQAIADGHDKAVEPALRPFFYLPFEHSEGAEDQVRSVALHQALADETGDPDVVKWAVLHQEIIDRFGRFPHRNAALGRRSTAEELDYLADDSSFKG